MNKFNNASWGKNQPVSSCMLIRKVNYLSFIWLTSKKGLAFCKHRVFQITFTALVSKNQGRDLVHLKLVI